MRKQVVLVVAVALVAAGSVASAAPAPQWKNVLKGLTHSSTSSDKLPASDIAAGLKQALAKGTTHAIDNLGRTNGFWDNAKLRIPLPHALKNVAKLARQLGQGKKVDAFQLSLNRAAEKAVPQVADIFGDAIRKMSITDARKILTGGDHAATDYFRRIAGKALTARIEPIVAKATDSVGVTRKYKALVSGSSGGAVGGLLSQLGGKSDHSSLNLDDYVTGKAIDGLFSEIGAQEAAIREHPAARTTALLKKVFGHK